MVSAAPLSSCNHQTIIRHILNLNESDNSHVIDTYKYYGSLTSIVVGSCIDKFSQNGWEIIERVMRKIEMGWIFQIFPARDV